MDILSILEQYGIPVCVAIAFGFFIWKQNKFIQDELMEELDERFKRTEMILIKLIDQQKLMQLELRALKASYNALVNIIKKLSGNGLRDKFKS